MRILVLAPHPFFQDRGTPIDMQLVLRGLSERGEQVDLVTFNEGSDVVLPGLSIHRTPNLKWLRGIRPGFSGKKLVCDFFLFFIALRLILRKKPGCIHACEESVFFALCFKWIFGIPYIYDLDSSIAQQMVEQKPRLKPLAPLFNFIEGFAIRRALINLPVCNALGDICANNQSPFTIVLHDISQLENPDAETSDYVKKELGIEGIVFLYVGNLEPYQGVDLLLEGFAKAYASVPKSHVVIVGGIPAHIQAAREKCLTLGIAERVHFLGPRPFSDLEKVLGGGDILVCPRIRGLNTPMKLFSYLHTGKPVLASKLPTHTQILKGDEAYLADPTPEEFGAAIIALATQPEVRSRIGAKGREMVEKNHVYHAYKTRLDSAYDYLARTLAEKV